MFGAPVPTDGQPPGKTAEAQSVPSSRGDQSTYDDIVVTAQRRSENLLSVPGSVSAETGENLAKKGIGEISSLLFTTPDLMPNNGAGYVMIFIRVVGNTLFVGADPSVATFVDDVPVPRIYGSLVNNFVNVENGVSKENFQLIQIYMRLCTF